LSPGEHQGNLLIHQVRGKLTEDGDFLLPLFDVTFTNCLLFFLLGSSSVFLQTVGNSQT
jgi:hypothetical protein